jgi:predicted alpha/beta superfamily hydrolase
MPGDDLPVLRNTEVHRLRSEHVGDEFKILIGRCDADAPAVLFLSDGDLLFGTAVEMTRLLVFTQDLPPLLVVGIGYPSRDNFMGLRQRDFTPTDVAEGADVDDPAMMAGADRFAAFIREELRPWVVHRFDTDTSDSVFFGTSLGGLFATHVLLTAPETFRRYGIGSPAYWWDNGVIFETEAAYADTHSDLPASVYVSIGAYETQAGADHYVSQLPSDRREAEAGPFPDMVGDAERMVATLRGRGYPSLDLEFETLAGEYHQTALPVNLSRSLRYLFGAPR